MDAADEFAAVQALEGRVEGGQSGGTGAHPFEGCGGDLQLGALRREVVDHGPGYLQGDERRRSNTGGLGDLP